jgi:hypothetical protein
MGRNPSVGGAYIENDTLGRAQAVRYLAFTQ